MRDLTILEQTRQETKQVKVKKASIEQLPPVYTLAYQTRDARTKKEGRKLCKKNI
jgi:hypothetical protein